MICFFESIRGVLQIQGAGVFMIGALTALSYLDKTGEWLRRFSPNGVQMALTTAVALAMIGASLWLIGSYAIFQKPKRR